VLEALDRGEAVEAQACTATNCGDAARGVKDLAGRLGVSVACKGTCKWFYSKQGGWQKECYVRCSGPGITIECTVGV
jgi:hypothetical protein